MLFTVGSVYRDFTSNQIYRFHGAPKEKRDYDSINGTIAPPHDDRPWSKRRCPKGISCFIFVELPHGPRGNAPAPARAFISRLPENWEAVYTHEMTLKLSDQKSTTTAHHFNIYSTIEITVSEFERVVSSSTDWPWNACSAVSSGFPSDIQIAGADDDLETLMHIVAYYLTVWYRSSDDFTDQLLMNDVYTWITSTKPDFEELAADSVRSSFIEYLIQTSLEDEDDPTGTVLLLDILEKLRSARNDYSI